MARRRATVTTGRGARISPWRHLTGHYEGAAHTDLDVKDVDAAVSLTARALRDVAHLDWDVPAAGFAATGVLESLLHTHDILGELWVHDGEPGPALAGGVLDRHFPHVPRGHEAWRPCSAGFTEAGTGEGLVRYVLRGSGAEQHQLPAGPPARRAGSAW